jgi:hypothetical protein
MNPSVGVAGRLARAFFSLFCRMGTNAATGRQPSTLDGEFPQAVEIIPGKLRVRVFLHEIKYEKETISCWSYVTDGLMSQKQKEIIFTLRRDESEKPEDYPRDFFEFFATILDYAARGQVADVGDSTLFAEAGFLGHRDFRGIGYVEPEGFPGVETGSVPLLAGILLKDDEAQIAWELGLTRVTALLGMKYRHYPCPAWSDLRREPVASLRTMDKSLLGKIARVGVRASYYEERNRIVLAVLPVSQPRLQEFLGKVPPTQPLALRTQPDSRANACLVWRSGEDQHMAITPPNSDGSRKTGAFLAFVPEQDANGIRVVEDGFLVLLTNSAWQTIREALMSGTDVFVPLAGVDGASISVEWAKAAGYTSPVTGETYMAEGWRTYEPESVSMKERVAVSSGRIVLLTSERDLQSRITAEDLGGYVNAIENAVDVFFTSPARRTSRELTIHLSLTAESQEIQVLASPYLTEDVGEELQKRLEDVPAPKVRGPVKLDCLLKVWRIASKQ